MESMMILARLQDGLVFELIQPFYGEDGIEVPMTERFPAEFLADCVDVTDQNPMPEQGWVGTKVGETWSFAPYIAPPPTPSEILATNTATRNYLLASANLVIPALQDAVDLDDPSANPALLLQWKQFRVAVNKVDLTKINPTWPVPPQSGYGADHSAIVSNA